MSKASAERWLPVVGHPGHEVSDQGRVRSTDRLVSYSDGRRRWYLGQVLNPGRDTRGYSFVKLPRFRYPRVHSLVLQAFVGPCPTGFEGCHGDGDPSNNHLENLRWDTRSENMLDINRYGCHPNTARTHCPRQHLLVMPNLVRCQLPGRTCLACNRAKAIVSSARRYGRRVPDFEALADQKYAIIMDRAPQTLPESSDADAVRPQRSGPATQR